MINELVCVPLHVLLPINYPHHCVCVNVAELTIETFL